MKLTQKYMFSKCLLRHDVVRVLVSSLVLVFCTGHFVMVPLNMTYLHCLQHSLFEHLFNLYLLLEVINCKIGRYNDNNVMMTHRVCLCAKI